MEHPRIHLIRSKIASAEVSPDNQIIHLDYEDSLSGFKQRAEFEMVILATGIIP